MWESLGRPQGTLQLIDLGVRTGFVYASHSVWHGRVQVEGKLNWTWDYIYGTIVSKLFAGFAHILSLHDPRCLGPHKAT